MDQLSSQSLSVAEMTCFFLQPEDLDLDTMKLTPVSPVPSMNSAFPQIAATFPSMSHVFYCLFLPQKFTSLRIALVIKGELQNPAEVKGKPTEGKHEDQAEYCLGHFSSLKQNNGSLQS